MSVLGLADATRAGALEKAVASPAAAGGWSTSVAADRYSVVVAGVPTGRAGSWTVAGSPVRDPWGVPIAGTSSEAERQAQCQALAEDFGRYGPAAVQLATGPFVAFNDADGTAVRSLSGTIPLHASTVGGWVVTTSAAVLGALGAGGGTLVPAGASVSPDGSSSAWGAIPPKLDDCRFPWAWNGRTIDQRVAPLGPLSAAPFATDVWLTDGEDVLFLPRLEALDGGNDPVARYDHLRLRVLPQNWWLARLAGKWLYAPAFERPVLDTLSMLRPSASVR